MSADTATPEISLVIPVYNERAIIDGAITQIVNFFKTHFAIGQWELVVSDDGSTDGSPDIARRHESGSVRVVGYKPNRGKGAAVRNGVLSARGKYIFFTDADLAYGLDLLPGALDCIRQDGAAALVGSRKLDPAGYAAYPLARKLTSSVYIAMIKLTCGLKLSDAQTGFKGFTQAAARDIFSKLQTERWAFDIEVLLIAQYQKRKITEYPVHIVNHRESKIHIISDSARMFRDMLRIRKSVRERFKRGEI